jgi:hypothetical protein
MTRKFVMVAVVYWMVLALLVWLSWTIGSDVPIIAKPQMRRVAILCTILPLGYLIWNQIRRTRGG